MCEIYDDGNRADVWTERTRRAAKPHRCESCGAVILPGERYRYGSGVHDHRGFSERGCTACAETHDAFGKAHHFCPAFEGLDDALVECIAEGDEESLAWKPHLEAILARFSTSSVARGVTKALVGWIEQREAVSS
jgi:hypothetical protein